MSCRKTENKPLALYLPELIQLRHKLHKYPELSGDEKNTSRLIIEYLSRYHPDRIITGIGGQGLAVIFNGRAKGPTVMFSCELDALPIEETNSFSYRSKHHLISHKCGHDGHMASVAALGPLLARTPPEKGRVVLLYRPAEETGEGAPRVVSDPKYSRIKPDYVFAFHNLPGFPLGNIIIKSGAMTWASSGMIIGLDGRTSHAAYPEQGNSPALAMCRILEEISQLPTGSDFDSKRNSCTIGYSRLGERTLGTAPGKAEIGLVLRSETDEELFRLFDRCKEIVEKHAIHHNLGYHAEWQEKFNAAINSDSAVRLVKKAAHELCYKLVSPGRAMKWADDIGELIRSGKGAFFCVGSGKRSPQLHNPDYDFPDSLIETAGSLFFQIVMQILNFRK